jgi:hypothetical protein
MLKKKLKWLLIPVVAATVFFTTSSFADGDEVKECWKISNGHYGPIVLGVQVIVCDGTGALVCSTKVDCPK